MLVHYQQNSNHLAINNPINDRYRARPDTLLCVPPSNHLRDSSSTSTGIWFCSDIGSQPCVIVACVCVMGIINIIHTFSYHVLKHPTLLVGENDSMMVEENQSICTSIALSFNFRILRGEECEEAASTRALNRSKIPPHTTYTELMWTHVVTPRATDGGYTRVQAQHKLKADL